MAPVGLHAAASAAPPSPPSGVGIVASTPPSLAVVPEDAPVPPLAVPDAVVPDPDPVVAPLVLPEPLPLLAPVPPLDPDGAGLLGLLPQAAANMPEAAMSATPARPRKVLRAFITAPRNSRNGKQGIRQLYSRYSSYRPCSRARRWRRSLPSRSDSHRVRLARTTLQARPRSYA